MDFIFITLKSVLRKATDLHEREGEDGPLMFYLNRAYNSMKDIHIFVLQINLLFCVDRKTDRSQCTHCSHRIAQYDWRVGEVTTAAHRIEEVFFTLRWHVTGFKHV